jgi:outer membrane receptor protein involved in Fe transport
MPNTDLLPEKIYSSQIGFIADFPIKTVTSVFVNYCEDLIRILYFQNVGKAVNISKTLNYGIENDISWKITPKFEISNNISLQEPKNISEKSTKKLYIPEESKLKINSEIQIGDFAGFSFIPQYSYKSSYFHDLYNVYRVPFDKDKKGLSFFTFVLQHRTKYLTTQIGVYDILASGNSPEKVTALESQYFSIRYPGMSVKGSVLLDIVGLNK